MHHDAVTHTENVPPVYEAKTSYHTVCNDCQQTIDGIADAHIKMCIRDRNVTPDEGYFSDGITVFKGEEDGSAVDVRCV